jgi:hypothetical protein
MGSGPIVLLLLVAAGLFGYWYMYVYKKTPDQPANTTAYPIIAAPPPSLKYVGSDTRLKGTYTKIADFSGIRKKYIDSGVAIPTGPGARDLNTVWKNETGVYIYDHYINENGVNVWSIGPSWDENTGGGVNADRYAYAYIPADVSAQIPAGKELLLFAFLAGYGTPAGGSFVNA